MSSFILIAGQVTTDGRGVGGVADVDTFILIAGQVTTDERGVGGVRGVDTFILIAGQRVPSIYLSRFSLRPHHAHVSTPSLAHDE